MDNNKIRVGSTIRPAIGFRLRRVVDVVPGLGVWVEGNDFVHHTKFVVVKF